MSNSYNAGYRQSVGIFIPPVLAQVWNSPRPTSQTAASFSTPLQVSRFVILATVVLLLTFSAVLRLTDSGGVHAFWLESLLTLAQLTVLAASYAVPAVRRHLGACIRLFCYMTAGLFVTIAAANGFNSDYAVGLLFIVPGLAAGYGAAVRDARSMAAFFLVTCLGVTAACLSTAGPTAGSFLFIASLFCISFVTLFVAAGWLDARKRYLASEERYRAVVEQASDGIFMLDARTFDVLDANPAFCQMVGASLSELRSTDVWDILEDADGGRMALRAFSGGWSRQIECVIRRSDGTRIIGELKVDRIYHSDGDVLSVVVHDITSRKEYEQRILGAKEAAEEIARFKSSLLANMSHEIRTPLSSILGWAAVLGSEVPDRQRDLVRLIEKSGKRLHNTLDSVIELAHLQANVKELRSVFFDLNDAARQVTECKKDDAAGKGLSLQLRISEDPMWVESDPAFLHRVLLHILDNAIKFTETGCVTVSVQRNAGEMALIVEDTGVGIGRDFMPCAFDEFKQESEGLSRDHEGSGLGLALVRRMTELLGGRVDVVSEQGVGTAFTVYLPDVARAHQRRCT